jgi:hypothetical protein
LIYFVVERTLEHRFFRSVIYDYEVRRACHDDEKALAEEKRL